MRSLKGIVGSFALLLRFAIGSSRQNARGYWGIGLNVLEFVSIRITKVYCGWTMRRLLIFVWTVLAVSLLSSCSTNSVSGDVGGNLPIPDSTTSITQGDLRIGPMDMLDIDVFGVDDLGGTYQVDFQGLLKMPLIGQFNVMGMSANELSQNLEQRYGETYLQDPDVSVTIADSVGRRITVDGSISSPGLYPITGEISLLQAVALAGGPTESANPRKVVVFRNVNGERHAAAFDLVAIRNGSNDDPDIFGNDIIIVDGSEARRSYGEVLRSLPLIALFMAF